jgi:hypothetical protein
VILATSVVIALIENSVFDYDNIAFEIFKAHMVSFLYFAVYWFTSKAEFKTNAYEVFMHRSQQEPLLLAVALAFLSLITTATAPYTGVAYMNYLVWLPITLAGAAFLDVLWVNQQEKKIASAEGGEHQGGFHYTVYWVSGLFIMIKALVVIYYWRDHATIWHSMRENIPTRSIQYNTSYNWLSPTF